MNVQRYADFLRKSLRTTQPLDNVHPDVFPTWPLRNDADAWLDYPRQVRRCSAGALVDNINAANTIRLGIRQSTQDVLTCIDKIVLASTIAQTFNVSPQLGLITDFPSAVPYRATDFRYGLNEQGTTYVSADTSGAPVPYSAFWGSIYVPANTSVVLDDLGWILHGGANPGTSTAGGRVVLEGSTIGVQQLRFAVWFREVRIETTER